MTSSRRPKPKRPIDEARANRVVRFIEELLVHTTDPWAGRPFILADWQRDDIIRPLFGTLNADRTRQYRTAYVELGRKNGKSQLAAAIALYCLIADGEEGAQVYGAACDRAQAAIVYDAAAKMVERSPYLSELCTIVDSRKRIVVPSTGSYYQVLPGKVAGRHGYNAHAVIFDEVHAQPNRNLWDVLTTSQGARTQPLVFAITTAGFDRQSICWELHHTAEQLLTGVVEDDPTFFAYIRSLPEDADWTDESLWYLANPGLEGYGGGDFRKIDELRVAVAQAKLRPAMENTVRRLYLSQWTSSESRWFGYGVWDACGGIVNEATLAGRVCYAGLDLSSTSDFTALALLFPWEEGEGYDVVMRFWLPRRAVERRADMRPTLEAWERAGFLTVTDGDVLDYGEVESEITRLADSFEVVELGYDPWHATELVQRLGDHAMNVVPVRQGAVTLTAPCERFEVLVINRQINHGGHPVLRWMADNVVLEERNDGSKKPSKNKSTEKIDGIAACITALERAMANSSAEAQFISFED